jgi:hypothetical protein
MNTNLASPGLFFKDSNGDSIKVGPVHVGTTAPNATPGAGGQAGNSKGELWLDTSSSRYVFKIWDGTDWRTEDGEFVNASGDTMTGALVMDNRQQVRFRETTANGTNFIAVQAPASVSSDKTITLPDVTGTVVTTGDTGSVTSTMILDGTIVNADIDASAAIAGTKISPNFGSQDITIGDKIIHDGDTNTAIRFPGSDIVSVETNGLERLRVHSDGNVSIGSTSNTGDELYVSGSIRAADSIKALAADSAAAPGYTWAGDEDTGMFRVGVDRLGISTGGIEIFEVNRTGAYGSGRRIIFDNSAEINTAANSLKLNPASTLELEGQTGVVRSLTVYNTTTASAANMFVASTGNLNRSTSSIKYKTDVEDAELSYSESLVFNSRPVWYRSLSESDPSEYSYWGFIAEEVAEIDPRMVHWGNDGPESVQYDRYVVHLVSVIQKQKQQLDAIEARLTALEANQ